MTKRLAIFAFTGLTTFVIGVLVARNAPDLFITKHECRGNRMVLRSELRDLLAWQELRSFENHDLRRLDQESAPALRNARIAATARGRSGAIVTSRRCLPQRPINCRTSFGLGSMFVSGRCAPYLGLRNGPSR